MNNQQLNVFEEPLEECSCNPITGFFRSGCCETSDQDIGNHTVCALMTKEFLLFSFEKGNDLISAVPQFDFPGLKPGEISGAFVQTDGWKPMKRILLPL